MGKKIGIFTAIACAFVLCFALVGCGGSSGPDKSKFVGTWELESGSDENLGAESIELMKSLGLQVTLTLKDDDTGTLNLFGEEMAVTWKLTDNQQGTISMADTGDATVKLSGDKLVMEDSSSSMTFARQGTAASASAAASASVQSASASAASSASEAASESAQSASTDAASSASEAASESAQSASADAPSTAEASSASSAS